MARSFLFWNVLSFWLGVVDFFRIILSCFCVAVLFFSSSTDFVLVSVCFGGPNAVCFLNGVYVFLIYSVFFLIVPGEFVGDYRVWCLDFVKCPFVNLWSFGS